MVQKTPMEFNMQLKLQSPHVQLGQQGFSFYDGLLPSKSTQVPKKHEFLKHHISKRLLTCI